MLDTTPASAVTQVLTDLNAALAKADPAAAAGLVPLLPAGDTQTRVALDVARALAAKTPAAALDFIAQLPAGSASTLALNNVLTSWVVTAPAHTCRPPSSLVRCRPITVSQLMPVRSLG